MPLNIEQGTGSRTTNHTQFCQYRNLLVATSSFFWVGPWVGGPGCVRRIHIVQGSRCELRPNSLNLS